MQRNCLQALFASRKDEWIKAQEDVMEEDEDVGPVEQPHHQRRNDDEFSLTYLSGFGVPGSVDEVRSSKSSSSASTRVATATSGRQSSHVSTQSRALRPTTAVKTRTSPRNIQMKVSQSVPEKKAAITTSATSITNKTAAASNSKKIGNQNNLQNKSGSDSKQLSLKSHRQSSSTEETSFPQLSSKPTQLSQQRQWQQQLIVGPDEESSSCARVIPVSVAVTNASAAAAVARYTSSTLRRYSSQLPVSSLNPSRPLPAHASLSSSRQFPSTSYGIPSRFTTFGPSTSSASSSSCGFVSSVGGVKMSPVRRHFVFPRPPAAATGLDDPQSSWPIRPATTTCTTGVGPSRSSTQPVVVRYGGSGNFEFVKPTNTPYKVSSQQAQEQQHPSQRIKPTLGDYERPRLFLRKRGEPRSGGEGGSSSSSSNAGPEGISESG